MPRLATFFLILVLLPASIVAQPQIEHLLDALSEPDGVVFEILEEDEDALTWALPLIRQLAERLRTRFSELPITVVSHGSEQFALLAAAIEGQLAARSVEVRGTASHANTHKGRWKPKALT
jgi:hypothetical protein